MSAHLLLGMSVSRVVDAREGIVCKVRTQDPENFDEEVKSLVTAWRPQSRDGYKVPRVNNFSILILSLSYLFLILSLISEFGAVIGFSRDSWEWLFSVTSLALVSCLTGASG